jgi:hypothetical protein
MAVSCSRLKESVMSRPAWLFVALITVPLSLARGQEAEPPAEEPAPQSERSLEAALTEASEVTLTPGQTVGEVVRGLAERHKVQIEFAKPELAEKPLQGLPNEVQLRGVPLMTALSFTVNGAGLAWQPRDERIVVGEREAVRGPAADRIRAAMRQDTRLEFPNTALRDALNFLADMHDINIIIDEQALSDAAVDVDDTVDIVLSGISLGDALNILLEPYDLTYVMANDVLQITTTDRAAREVDTRSYDVSAVVGENGYATEAAEVLTQLLEPRSALAGALIAAEGKPPVPLPQPRVVPFKQKLLVTASWADQRRVEEILRLMEGAEK